MALQFYKGLALTGLIYVTLIATSVLIALAQ